jgi:hypothetical protein
MKENNKSSTAQRNRIVKLIFGIIVVVVSGTAIQERLQQHKHFQQEIIFPTTTSTSTSTSTTTESSSSAASPTVCFVTAAYAADQSKIDRVAPVRNVPHDFRFYLFTNLEDLQPPPGWTKIVTHLPYKRYVTHAKYTKLQVWREPQIQDCGGVYYMDGTVTPLPDAHVWRNLTSVIRASEIPLMQDKHPDNKVDIASEFQAIIKHKKDTPSNVEKTKHWMQNQTDYDPHSQVYLTRYFGYNPNNLQFQTLAQAFWDHYSMELDSWRDQPLWAYILHKYQIVPKAFPSSLLFEEHSSAKGFGGHTYKSEKDVHVLAT